MGRRKEAGWVYYIKNMTFEGSGKDDAERLLKGVRAGLRTAPIHWQRKFAPTHFKPIAMHFYGYEPRSLKYRKRKERKFGHNNPLEFSGDTKRWVRTRFATPRISKGAFESLSAKLAVHVPKYIYMHRTNQPDKADELTRTMESESKKLMEIIRDQVDLELQKPRRKRTVKVGG